LNVVIDFTMNWVIYRDWCFTTQSRGSGWD